MKGNLLLFYLVLIVSVEAENTKWVSERSFYSSFAGWSKYAIQIEEGKKITGMLLYAKTENDKIVGVVKPQELQRKYDFSKKGKVYILKSESKKLFGIRKNNRLYIYNDKNENLYVLRKVQSFDEVKEDIFMNVQNELEISKVQK